MLTVGWIVVCVMCFIGGAAVQFLYTQTYVDNFMAHARIKISLYEKQIEIYECLVDEYDEMLMTLEQEQELE